MDTPALGPVLYSFFEDHLKVQKGLRPTSLKSYRDTLRLFLDFVCKDARRKITRLSLKDLTCGRVLRFLTTLEEERKNHIRTRNQRLVALRAFFEYLARRAPETLVEAERVAAIPTKRVPPPETLYLEREQIDTLFANLPSTGRLALRDRALLLFLYNTGTRVQEVADLRVKNLELSPSFRAHLHGKGGKWRVCPLWDATASILRELLSQETAGGESNRPVFVSDRGQPLTRFGIYKIVRRCTQGLVTRKAGTERRGISPHVFRHTTAVHLLEAGVEPNVIRAWLGHVSLDTTNRYAEINIRMKEKALQACQPPVPSSEGFPRKAVWRDDQSLLNWLESL